MSKRYQGGILGAGFDPLRAPNAPRNVAVTGNDVALSITFNAPADPGGAAVTSYTARSTPTGVSTATPASPISLFDLTSALGYTFDVWAINSYGPSPSSSIPAVSTSVAPRGVFAGGDTGSKTNRIDYVTITTLGNASVFGQLTIRANNIWGCSCAIRGLFGGGNGGGNVICYITIASGSDASDFGDLRSVTNVYMGACASDTRGVLAGESSSVSNRIDYVTFSTLGNSMAFGQLSTAATEPAGCSSPTRGLFGGGNRSTLIQYVTIATTGNSVFFGDLTNGRQQPSACSSSTRGVFAGGGAAASNIIDYVTIATLGNATDFGDLSGISYAGAGSSSQTRGLFALGSVDGIGYVNTIDYITIATTGNAADFGDLTQARGGLAACSSAHGGLT